jgi:hypothetical protein
VCKRKRRLVQLALELHGNDYQQDSVEMKNRDTVEITPRALHLQYVGNTAAVPTSRLVASVTGTGIQCVIS